MNTSVQQLRMCLLTVCVFIHHYGHNDVIGAFPPCVLEVGGSQLSILELLRAPARSWLRGMAARALQRWGTILH